MIGGRVAGDGGETGRSLEKAPEAAIDKYSLRDEKESKVDQILRGGGETSVAKLVVGLSGASGSILGVRLLEVLRDRGVETHLVVSKWAQQTLEHETDLAIDAVRALASHHYATGDLGAAIASGSFATDGMIIMPCSMRSVAAIAQGYSENLLLRAAEVTLKESRRLVLVPRETPLSQIHLENLLKLARMGVIILPPMPAFYHRPETVADLVDDLIARVLDQFGLAPDFARRWQGERRIVPLKRGR